jgi:hypothetical protein
MAEWNLNPTWTPKEQINGGEQFSADDVLSPDDFNALVNNMQYLYENGGDFEVNPYPIGTVYMSFNGTSPASLFGGSWTQLKSKFLLASSNTATSSATPMYNSTTTGGSADAVTVAHTHNFVGTGGDIDGYDASFLLRGNPNASYRNPAWYFGSFNTDSGQLSLKTAGESGVGKNMPPYQVVYMWRRVS